MGPVGKAQQFHLMLIPIDQPFNLTHTLECGQAFRWRREGDWYYGVIYGNILKIRQTLLGVEFNSYPLPEEEIVNRLAYYLRLDDDLPEIYRIIGRDYRMRHAIAQYFGLRLLRQEPWECLVSFICSISSNIPRISQSIESLCGKMGDRLEMDGHVRFSFPGPEKVMELGETGLRLMGMGFRAPYLADTADRIGRGVYDLEGLRELNYDDAKKDLMTLFGVGDKVADCVLLFSLEKLDSFPIDRWVRRAVEEWYSVGENPSYDAIRTWALDYFGVHAGYAQQYLFQGRRLEKKSASSQTLPATP